MTPHGKHTIVTAIAEVLRAGAHPMTVEEIHDAIVKHRLFQFKTAAATHVVRTQLRRHTKGLVMTAAATTKLFSVTADGKYSLLAGAKI